MKKKTFKTISILSIPTLLIACSNNSESSDPTNINSNINNPTLSKKNLKSSSLISNFSKNYQEIKTWQESLYKNLHQHPELSSQEFKTAKIIENKLNEYGFEVKTGIGKTGLVGILKNGDGPVVLARADMDALPIKEETSLPYSSKVTGKDAQGNEVNVMHACGHDTHVSSLLGAAEIMQKSKKDWKGTFIALFQPAEEAGSGAQQMVDDGLDKYIPKPDIVIGQHVVPLPAGFIGMHEGNFYAEAKSARVKVFGKSAHASTPELSVDPAVLVSTIVTRLQTIVSREISSKESGVITVAKINVGNKGNVIPDFGEFEINFRASTPNTINKLTSAAERIIKAETEASRSPKPAEIEYFDHYPALKNDKKNSELIKSKMISVFGNNKVLDPGTVPASEDVGVIASHFNAPLVYWLLGGSNLSEENMKKMAETGEIPSDVPSNHNSKYAPIVQPTLEAGTKALIVAIGTYLAID